MNVSSACPQCGAIANPNDKFCNTCGTPLRAAPPPAGSGGGGPAAPPQAYAPPPPQQYGAQPPGPPPGQPYPGGYAPQPAYPSPQGQGYPPPAQPPQYGSAPRTPRCQLGHDIMPGMSYCPQGHPIALDAMQFAGDPPPPQQSPYASSSYQNPQPAGGSPFDAPRMGVGGAPAPQPGGFGPPQAYAPQPAPGYGAPPQGYGQPVPQPPQPVFQPAPVPPPAPVQAHGGYAPPPPVAGIGGAETLDRAAAGGKVLRGFLVSFQANATGDFWPLFTGRATIGRANAPEPADVPLADATISSRHAAFVIDGNAIVLEDTSSTNGTYVNEEHIGQNGRRELRDGDRIRFGGFTTIVKVLGRL